MTRKCVSQSEKFKEILNPKAMDQIHWNVHLKTGFLIEDRVTRFNHPLLLDQENNCESTGSQFGTFDHPVNFVLLIIGQSLYIDLKLVVWVTCCSTVSNYEREKEREREVDGRGGWCSMFIKRPLLWSLNFDSRRWKRNWSYIDRPQGGAIVRWWFIFWRKRLMTTTQMKILSTLSYPPTTTIPLSLYLILHTFMLSITLVNSSHKYLQIPKETRRC